MYYELSKSQKKIARKVMDKGLEKDYKKGLHLAEEILEKWRKSILSTRDAYMKLYQGIKKTDIEIAKRYNDKGGSRWVEVMADQLSAGVINPEDLDEFEDSVRNVIIFLSGTEVD